METRPGIPGTPGDASQQRQNRRQVETGAVRRSAGAAVAGAARRRRLEVVRSTPKMAAPIGVQPFHVRQSARQIFGFKLVAILCPRAERTPAVSRGLLFPSKAQQVWQVDERNHAALNRHQLRR